MELFLYVIFANLSFYFEILPVVSVLPSSCWGEVYILVLRLKSYIFAVLMLIEYKNVDAQCCFNVCSLLNDLFLRTSKSYFVMTQPCVPCG